MPLNLDDYSDEMLLLALKIARAKKTPRLTRLKVAFFFLERKFPIPRFLEPGDAIRPVQVIIGTTATVSVNGHDLDTTPHAGLAIRTDGLRFHADGGNGHGA